MKAYIPQYLTIILNSYLQDRTETIRIGIYLEPQVPSLNCVPQWGCLSPTLFSFYTADIPPPSGKNETIVYADDVTQTIMKQGSDKYLAAEAVRDVKNKNKSNVSL